MPIVNTRDTEYHPERVIKKEWGVIMITGTDKRSIPWHQITGVCEAIPENDSPKTRPADELITASDGGEVLQE